MKKNVAAMKKSAPKFVDDTHVLVTKEFAKNAKIFGTAEYKLWKEIRKDCEEDVMVTKTIKKNPNKKNDTKNMTYENMAAFIREQDDAEAVMAEFQKQINLSKVKANPYRAVLAWFKKKYSDVNDYMDFFEEQAAKNAAESDMFAVPTAANL